MLLGLAGLPLWVGAPLLSGLSAPWLWLAVLGLLLVAAGLVWAGLLFPVRMSRATWVTAVCLAVCLGLGTDQLLQSPAWTLATLLALLLLGAWMLQLKAAPGALIGQPNDDWTVQRLRGAGYVALGSWWLVLSGSHQEAGLSFLGWTGALWALALIGMLAMLWAQRMYPRQRLRVLALLAGLCVPVVLWVAWPAGPERLAPLLALPALSVLLLVPTRLQGSLDTQLFELLVSRPERLFVGTFGLLCGGGALLLMLPQCVEAGQELHFIDALFTAVSAVCVTGLAVVDTPQTFSGLGEGCLLLLIQVGGLGMMTFSTAGAWLFGMQLSMRYERAAADWVGVTDHRQLFAATKRVLSFTIVSELAGAFILWLAFCQSGDPLGTAAWRALFTSVSAFCNAGFALQSDSLIPYQTKPVILHTVSALIILGGLSPTVVMDFPALYRGVRRPNHLQARLALLTTAGLLLLGLMLIVAIEWNGALRTLEPWDRFHNAWFQSVTLRTAGFNSVGFEHLAPATVLLFILLMLIGGSPGGTAGGVKTTTLAILWLSMLQVINGQQRAQAFGRQVSLRSIQRAGAVVTVAGLFFFVSLTLIQLTQDMPEVMATFEVASALGTAGLTLGGTAKLDSVGKLIIAACMFAGRVGGLALLLIVANRADSVSPLARPQEEIDVG